VLRPSTIAFWLLHGGAPPLLSCFLLVDLSALNAAPAPGSSANCTLWEVVDALGCVPPAAHAGEERGSPQYALLRCAHSLDYLLGTYRLGLLSAVAYGRLHGYRVFAYAPVLPVPRQDVWERIVMSKYRGVDLLLKHLDESDAPERAVFFADLDGWMNLTPAPQFSIGAVVDRARGARPTGSPDFFLLLQGESDLCSCVFVVWRTDLGRGLFDRIRTDCLRPVQRSPLCFTHPFDQIAFWREVAFRINGTNGFRAVPDTLCTNLDSTCWMNDVLPEIKEPSWASRAWPGVAFVPQGGTNEAPELHSCMSSWGLCDDSVSVWYHTGSRAWPDANPRRAAERSLGEFVLGQRRCPVDGYAVQALRDAADKGTSVVAR